MGHQCTGSGRLQALQKETPAIVGLDSINEAIEGALIANLFRNEALGEETIFVLVRKIEALREKTIIVLFSSIEALREERIVALDSNIEARGHGPIDAR
jgi:hypothetical protein